MTKVILMSIKPKHLENILNGKKTKELRKSIPKDFKGWVYLYCTLDKQKRHSYLNGKVVARFWFSTLWFDVTDYYPYCPLDYPEPSPTFEDDDCVLTFECDDGYWVNGVDLDKICMTYEEMLNYGNGKDLYAWNIRNLEIFDKPMELSDFYTKATVKDFDLWLLESDYFDFSYWKRITRAPKSWQYAWTRK